MNFIKIQLFFIFFVLKITSNLTKSQITEGEPCQLYNGSNGICKRLHSCQFMKDGIRNGWLTYEDIRKSRCMFQESTEITCCPDGLQTPPTTVGTTPTVPTKKPTLPNISRTSIRKSDLACERYEKDAYVPVQYEIINGTDASFGEFPHMVALGIQSDVAGGDDIQFTCGGSLISEQYVLTAAHCVLERVQPTIVRLGMLDLKEKKHENAADIPVDRIILHPSYRSRGNRYHDIALIRLSRAITINADVRPACLWTNISDLDTRTELLITGWGSISDEKEIRSNVLLKAAVRSVPLQSCNESYLEYAPLNVGGVITGQMCAGDSVGFNNTCKGDSGGPIQIYKDTGLSIITGVTSFGVTCASTIPSIYTRVAYYLDWIEKNVWGEGDSTT